MGLVYTSFKVLPHADHTSSEVKSYKLTPEELSKYSNVKPDEKKSIIKLASGKQVKAIRDREKAEKQKLK